MQWVDSTSKIYPHIVYEELSKAESIDQCADIAVVDKDNYTLEGLYYNLDQASILLYLTLL
jgi:hypothetical protein